ncbi:hypothetical protein ACFO0N_02800 [Halobium salinum]|uniref:Flagellin n=1 Tax=Halobium salinum TaxID=1364940 RepID=A0ABD5P7N2_9EURY|nr:hypothetical protein [Halobium salinum]
MTDTGSGGPGVGAAGALRGDRRGVSEVLGFVLVFGLVLSSVGIVYVAGQQGLQDARDFERVNNAERAFDVLADNVDDVARDSAPSRATELKLADAGLSVDEPTVVNVTAAHPTTAAKSMTTEYEVSPLVYEADGGSQVVYSNGAVLRSEREGAVVTRQPDLVLDDGDADEMRTDRAIIPVVATRPARDAGTNVAGSTTVLVRTERATERVFVTERDETEPYHLYLNVTTPRTDAWERYLEDATPNADDCSVDGDTVECDVEGVERVYVTVVEIDVSIE